MSKIVESNMDQVMAFIQRDLKMREKKTEQAASQFLTNVVAGAKGNVARNRSIASGELISSISRTKWEAGSNAPYAPFVEFGTKSKTRIPPDGEIQAIAREYRNKRSFGKMWDNIVKWARLKGILDESVIFRIARSIAKKGNEAKPFFYPSVFMNKHRLLRDIMRVWR